jgi:hypothetical protein
MGCLTAKMHAEHVEMMEQVTAVSLTMKPRLYQGGATDGWGSHPWGKEDDLHTVSMNLSRSVSGASDTDDPVLPRKRLRRKRVAADRNASSDKVVSDEAGSCSMSNSTAIDC